MKRIRLTPLFLAALVFGATTQTATAQGAWSTSERTSVRFRLGLFEPQAESSYWDEKFSVWSGSTSDLQDLVWGIDALWMLSENSAFQVGSSGYRGETYQVYRDWVGDSGAEIGHVMELDTWELTAAWVFRPRTRTPLQPYFGLGGGLLGWRLVERGDFLNFVPGPDVEIFTARYGDEGITFLAFAEIGLEFRLEAPWSFFVEGRWKEAEASLGGGFADLDQDLDLSGPELSLGFAMTF